MDILKKKKNIVRAIVILLLLYLVLGQWFVLSVLMAISLSMSYLVNKLNLRQFGFEFVTFIAVILGASKKFSPLFALGITFILITYHLVAGGFIAQYVFWVIPAYCVAAILAGIFYGGNIIRLGIYLSVAINTNNVFFTAVKSPGFLAKYMQYVITNIIFNVFLFSLLGKLILAII